MPDKPRVVGTSCLEWSARLALIDRLPTWVIRPKGLGLLKVKILPWLLPQRSPWVIQQHPSQFCLFSLAAVLPCLENSSKSRRHFKPRRFRCAAFRRARSRSSAACSPKRGHPLNQLETFPAPADLKRMRPAADLMRAAGRCFAQHQRLQSTSSAS